MKSRDEHVLLGFNNRMTEMEAAMGMVQLKKLDTFNQARIANSEYLLERVQEFPWAVVPVPPQNLVKHTYFWCPVMVNKSSGKSIEQLKKHLILNKVGFRQRYKEPLYRQPILKHLGAVNSNVFLPNVEKVAGEIIGLPNHPKLTKGDLNRIITVLKSF
jgi:dTDP-4-amino-4,6-dideoxygalactose transaminase